MLYIWVVNLLNFYTLLYIWVLFLYMPEKVAVEMGHVLIGGAVDMRGLIKTRIEKMKKSLCIKSNGTPVDMSKVQNMATSNSIQVSKTTVQDNGDVYVDLPSEENCDKIVPLLEENNEVVKLKSKLPTISILNVKDFESKEQFVEKMKRQNRGIKDLIDQGGEFSIVFAKKPKETSAENGKNNYYQIVARVSDEIRKVIKMSGNKIYMDLLAYKVVDRFYVKRCNKCQQFGHYEKDCTSDVFCGYCHQTHLSSECDQVAEGDYDHYDCINCSRAGKKSLGHSSLWHTCPTFIEQQNKVKKSIPYYQKNY